MFSDNEIELVTRNIEEILSFHEAFIDELRTALIPLGFSMFDGPEAGGVLHTRQKEGIGPPEYQLEEAITVVSKTFTRRVGCTSMAIWFSMLLIIYTGGAFRFVPVFLRWSLRSF